MNNPDDHFSKINIPFLKNFVRDIIQKNFERLPLKRVILYRYFSKWPFLINVAKKYVISFELGINRDRLEADQRKIVEDLDVLGNDVYGRQTLFDKDALNYYWGSKKSVREGCRKGLIEDDRDYYWGLDDSFRKVYRNGPTKEDYLIEWELLVKMPNEEMPLGVMIYEPHVTLYDSSGKKGKKQDFQYLFTQEGPAWTIYYEGRPLSGFKGTGFAYIHYLIENQGKEFCPEDLLSAVDTLPPQELGFRKIGYENAEMKRKAKNSTDSRNIIDQKGLDELKNQRNYLKAEIDKAEENNDLERAIRAKEKLEEFEEHFLKSVDLHGKSRKFPGDDATKNKERIRKAIERALKKILAYDKEAGEHFKKAISKPDSCSRTFCYSPHPSIAWKKS
jgi:hypothetical protein